MRQQRGELLDGRYHLVDGGLGDRAARGALGVEVDRSVLGLPGPDLLDGILERGPGRVLDHPHGVGCCAPHGRVLHKNFRHVTSSTGEPRVKTPYTAFGSSAQEEHRVNYPAHPRCTSFLPLRRICSAPLGPETSRVNPGRTRRAGYRSTVGSPPVRPAIPVSRRVITVRAVRLRLCRVSRTGPRGSRRRRKRGSLDVPHHRSSRGHGCRTGEHPAFLRRTPNARAWTSSNSICT